MCGIFGIWHLDKSPIDLVVVQQATTLLRHRGPDDEGFLLVNTQTGCAVLCGGRDTDPSLNLPPIEAFLGDTFDLALGFRRLAILDLSPAGHQPMASADGRFWIIFNGEIYNYLELRGELASYGYTFRTGTDTEVILAAFQQWGADCLSRFNGMWAFAIWDSQERCLFLARDRFGVKPLHYVSKNGKFACASEIKALVGKHLVPFQPNDEMIYRYLVADLLPSPRQGQTFFADIRSLPPAHCLRVDLKDGCAIQQRYWALRDLPVDSTYSAAQAVELYRDLYTDAVQLHLQSDVPVGTCLSGGLDSSSIACVINRLMIQGGLSTKQVGDRQRTFSAVYATEGRYNERAYIEKVLNATDAEGNFTFPTAERLQTDMEQLTWHQEEPFRSSSIFAQWCVMSKVRERGVTVLLDGQGADEVLGGYRPFEFFLRDILRQAGPWRAAQEAQAVQATTSLSAGYLLARSLIHWLPDPLLYPVRQLRARRRGTLAYLHPDFAARFRKQIGADWVNWSEHATLHRHLQTLVEETSLPHLLRYEDRNSMAFSIEARVPYLDYRLVEFSFAEAAKWRILHGWTKWVLRKAMEGWVPDEIVWRKDKIGFETPEEEWLREWLGTDLSMFEDHALTQPYLNVPIVCHTLKQWVALKTPTPLKRVRSIWRWVNLETWLRLWQSA